MEEPQGVQADENGALLDKKPKRIHKTPKQLIALENFYNEHKYPSEAMKLEVAESIGLSEKQVSGWFCHRRLKDKNKSPNDEIQTHGKQDRSSGVIQDRGSGLRQDSCGSTKQGDNKHFEPKEVESRRFPAGGLFPTEVPFDHVSQHNNNMDVDDDTSSGSSSPIKDKFRPQNVDRLGTLTSTYPTHSDVKSVKGRTGPSGFLKVKGQVENAAITAVKRQLGRHYREDGPPLGIEFEELPPGAFENLVTDPVNQSYYYSDRTALQSLDGSNSFQRPNSNNMYERYNPQSYHSMDLDESGVEIRHAPRHREKQSDSYYKQTLPLSKHRDSLPGRSFQMEVNDDSAGATSIHDLREHFDTKIKHGPGVRRPDSLSNRHPVAYGRNFDSKQAENYPRSHNNGPPRVNYIDRIEPLTSDLTVKRGEFAELEDGGLSRKISKDGQFDGERRGIDKYSKLVSVKGHPGNEMKITKRSRDDFTHQVYPRKEAVADFPPINNKTKRPTAHMISSFSDDETAEATSSGG